MFQIGDVVVCGSNGVCKIESIGPLNMGKSTINRGDYYTLSPYFDNGGKIYLPVDNDRVNMRYILTKDEVSSLMDEFDALEPIVITDEKLRETEYKNAVNSSDPRMLIKVIKTMNFRRRSRIENGKKSTAIDEKYSKIAEHRLYDELALSLELEQGEVKEIIRPHLDK